MAVPDVSRSIGVPTSTPAAGAAPPLMESVSCYLCGEAQSVPLWTVRRAHYTASPERFTIVRCARCGFLFTNPRPVEAAAASYYPARYSPRRVINPAGPHSLGYRLRAAVFRARYDRAPTWADRVVSWLIGGWFYVPPLLGGRRVLDVGCGGGHLLWLLHMMGFSVKGVELDEGLAARVRAATGLAVYGGDLRQAGLPAGSADVVVLDSVLEHVYEPVSLLCEIRRLLAPGGVVQIAVPNAGSLHAGALGPHWWGCAAPLHVYHYTPQSLQALLRKAGLEVMAYARGLPAFLSALWDVHILWLNIVIRNDHDLPLARRVARFAGAVVQTIRAYLVPRLVGSAQGALLDAHLVAIARRSGSADASTGRAVIREAP